MANKNSVEVSSQIGYLYDIFSAPLVATVEADMMAAARAVEIIRKYGFHEAESQDDNNENNNNVEEGTESSETGFGKLRTLTFTYDRQEVVDGNMKTVKVQIKIPLLSLFPLPLLQVENASFKFDVRITSFTGEAVNSDVPPPLVENMSKKKSSGPSQQILRSPVPKVTAVLSPMVSGANESKIAPNLNANMKVEINLKQADMPSGISNLINLMSESAYIEKNYEEEEEEI